MMRIFISVIIWMTQTMKNKIKVHCQMIIKIALEILLIEVMKIFL